MCVSNDDEPTFEISYRHNIRKSRARRYFSVFFSLLRYATTCRHERRLTNFFPIFVFPFRFFFSFNRETDVSTLVSDYNTGVQCSYIYRIELM